VVSLGYASITKVNTLLPLPNPRTHSSSFPLRDSRIFRPHSARLFRLPRLAAAGTPLAALAALTVVVLSRCD